MATRKTTARRPAGKARKFAPLDREAIKLDLIGVRAAVTCAAVHLQHHGGVDAQFATTLQRAALKPLDTLITLLENCEVRS